MENIINIPFIYIDKFSKNYIKKNSKKIKIKFLQLENIKITQHIVEKERKIRLKQKMLKKFKNFFG